MFPPIFLKRPLAGEEEEPPPPPRQSRPPFPRANPSLLCPDELRYERDENLAVSVQRISGASASFGRSPVFAPEELEPETWEDVVKLWSAVDRHPNTQSVVLDIYRPDWGPSETVSFRQREGETLRRTGRFHPQYRLKLTTRPVTLVHIINSDVFADGDGDADDIEVPVTGKKLYTNGSIWTSTNPEWEWMGRGGLGRDSERTFRCRIVVPAGTKVAMDMAPVKVNPCRLDADSTSVFPDVVLLPSTFEVTSVQRYSKQDLETITDQYVRKALAPAERGEFVDVGMTLTQGVRLPDKLDLPKSVLESLRD